MSSMVELASLSLDRWLQAELLIGMPSASYITEALCATTHTMQVSEKHTTPAPPSVRHTNRTCPSPVAVTNSIGHWFSGSFMSEVTGAWSTSRHVLDGIIALVAALVSDMHNRDGLNAGVVYQTWPVWESLLVTSYAGISNWHIREKATGCDLKASKDADVETDRYGDPRGNIS
ncbi:hypothetical protein An02g04570 [Aspergillus niger]|uniref:Uncharacterized protein n=2 Tax=Aspergillus niger TaxID=5061 RepID=A2QCS5_ASPNC|nr:hypothetical protein An02g04570 [Aspergillus niger]CAK37597.1 hypothetical protein An02g04570 [Aspergillus niger]